MVRAMEGRLWWVRRELQDHPKQILGGLPTHPDEYAALGPAIAPRPRTIKLVRGPVASARWESDRPEQHHCFQAVGNAKAPNGLQVIRAERIGAALHQEWLGVPSIASIQRAE